MPEYSLSVDYDGTPIEYASEDEVLEFVNKVREVGGGDILKALMPSIPGKAHACLIAQGLNFGCAVWPIYERYPSGEWKGWRMEVDAAIADKLIADDELGFEYLDNTRHVGYDGIINLSLPRRIGAAAQAFDDHQGWTTKYELAGEDK